MKYTPGPWFAVNYAGYNNLQAQEYYGEPDLLNEQQSVNAEENARLAAAAPELLEALKDIIESGCIPNLLFEKANNAIKKAIL